MKRFMSGILCTAVLLSTSTVGLANSGPVYWQGYPSTGIMSIQKNSPITVEHEDLVFDFSDYDDSFYTVSGRVTAAYRMTNPAREAQSVQMAFPFVGSINSLSAGDIVITADDETLPYEVYIGDANTRFEFDDIVNTVTNEPYSAENFSENETGRLYTIHVEPATGQEINLAVDFSFDAEKTKVFTGGFNRYERDGQSTRIASWCRKPEVLEVFVLGRDIEFDINAYTDGELSQKTGLFSYRVEKQDAALKPYLIKYAKKHTNAVDTDPVSDVQLYNLYAAALDNHFNKHAGFCPEDELMRQREQERVITLVYTVEFPPESRKNVCVGFTAAGTMDGRQTTKPLYSFRYILNPAKNWAGFKDLNVEIIPPPEAPYVIESSIALTREESGVYRAALEHLPEDDLSFTLYAFEKITLLDRMVGSVQRRFGYLTVVVGAVLPLVAAAFVAAVVIRRKKTPL